MCASCGLPLSRNPYRVLFFLPAFSGDWMASKYRLENTTLDPRIYIGNARVNNPTQVVIYDISIRRRIGIFQASGNVTDSDVFGAVLAHSLLAALCAFAESRLP